MVTNVQTTANSGDHGKQLCGTVATIVLTLTAKDVMSQTG